MDYQTDIQPLEGEGVSDKQIAETLNANPAKQRDIPADDLIAYLHETGILFISGMDGKAGGVLRAVYDNPETPTNVRVGLDWLRSHLDNAKTPVRTTRPDIGGLLDGLMAVLSSPGVAELLPVPFDKIKTQIDEWTGGNKHQGVTAEDIATVRAEYEQAQAAVALSAEIAALENNIFGAIALEREKPDHTIETVRAAVLSAIGGE